MGKQEDKSQDLNINTQMQDLIDAQLVKIGQASQILGVSIDTLRRWEKAGKIEAVRTPGGTRLYSLALLSQLQNKEVQIEQKKLHISQAAQKLGLSVKTLRRWDHSGKLPAQRDEHGERVYTAGQISNLSRQNFKSPITHIEKVIEKLPENAFLMPKWLAKTALTLTTLTALIVFSLTAGYLFFPKQTLLLTNTNQPEKTQLSLTNSKPQVSIQQGQVLGIETGPLSLLQQAGTIALFPFNALSEKLIQTLSPKSAANLGFTSHEQSQDKQISQTQSQANNLAQNANILQTTVNSLTDLLNNSQASFSGQIQNLHSLTRIVNTNGTNLLRNSSFEANSSDQPQSWFYTNQSTSDNTFVNNQAVRTGNLALRIKPQGISNTGTATSFGIYQPYFVTTAGKQYTLSAYLNNQSGQTVTLRLSFWDKNNKKTALSQTFPVSSYKDWQRYIFSLDPPSQGVDGNGYFPMIEILGQSQGNVFLDDIELSEGLASPVYVQNNLQLGDNSVFADANANIYPALNKNGSLGMDSNRFGSLYLTGGSIDSSGNTTLKGDVTINGTLTAGGTATFNNGTLNSSATSYNLLNTTVTTLNIGGAATAISIGAATGTTTINNTLAITGSTTFADGTVSSPGITFTNDTDTGIYRSGANTLDFSSGGVRTLSLNTATSGVNYLSFTPAATGSGPTITAAGSDTNVSLTINSKAAGALTLDSTTTGTVNLASGNNAKTINIGTGTAGNTINIGSNNTTADTISIGSALDSLALSSANWSITSGGTASFNGNLTFGDAISDTITFTGHVASSILPTTDGGYDLGSSALRFNNLYVATINATGTNTSGQAAFTYQPTSSVIGQGSVWINPTTASAARPLLSVSVGGIEKARITTDGYLGLNGANDPGSTYIINAGTPFNVTTSGNLALTDSSTTASSKTISISKTGNITGTGYGLYSTVTSTSTTNVAGYFSATNGTSNYGLLVENGNVGVGTTTPTATLHVVGQCVAVGTKIRRRKRGKNGELLDDWEEVPVEDILHDDQILTLNDKTGQWETHSVEKTMDMGIQTVFRLETEGGKWIETTANHPYLVRENSSKAQKTRLSADSLTNSTIDTYATGLSVMSVPQKLKFVKSNSGPEGNRTPATRWVKVSQLKIGAEIATVDGWEKIVTIKEAGRVQTYDLQVEGTHNFVGNDIVAHNTYINSSTATGIALDIDANSLSSGSGLDISSTSTAAASNTQKGLNIALSGTNATSAQTTYGAYISNTHAGTTSTNVGLYATATGGTTANYAAIFEAGNVGIGTTAPAGLLHVAGQCVTGDTLLKRRRRRRRKDGTWEDVWEDIAIKDIKPGDEILTLDENTGEFIVSKVNALMDMGTKDIIKITSASGKIIRTTANHPYLAKESLPFVFIDETGIFKEDGTSMMGVGALQFFGSLAQINRELRDVFLSAVNQFEQDKKTFEFKFNYVKPTNLTFYKEILRVLKKYETQWEFSCYLKQRSKGSFWKQYLFLLYDVLQNISGKYTVLADYLNQPGRSSRSIEIVKKLHQVANILQVESQGSVFLQVVDILLGAVAFDLSKGKNAYRAKIAKKVKKLLKNKKRAGVSQAYAAQEVGTVSHSTSQSIIPLDISDVKASRWTKVKDLYVGAEIATVDGFEQIVKIEHLPAEQVFDIEIENTHNFVGNNIVAHNTAIFGAGEGATPTVTTLRGAAAAGTNIAGANFTFDASNGTGTGGSGALIFRTAPTAATGSTANTLAEIMRITPGGNVGIGTTGPGAKLDIANTSQLTERIRLSGQEFYAAGNTDTNGVSLLLGVNRTANRQLWIGDSAALTQNTTNGVLRILVGGTGTPHINAIATDGLTAKDLQIDAANVLLQPSSGNVGIGTTTPAAQLDILTAATSTGINLAGTAPVSVAGNGTSAATNTLAVVGTAGGASSGVTGQTGGTGGALSLTGGIGGAVAGASGIGGIGGGLTFAGGAGGNGAATGGAGGAISITAGAAGTGGNANGGTLTLNSGAVTGNGTSTINLGSSNTTNLNIGTASVADTITIGNATGATSLAFTSGTGSQTHTSSVVSGTTTTSANVFTDSALTTGTLSYLTSSSITTGKLLDIADTNNTWTGNGTTNGLINLASSSTAGTASSQSILLNLSRSGANAQLAHTAYGLYSAVTNTNATGTNIAGYFSASGATTANYGLIVANGNVGIGTTAPTATLHVVGQCVTGDTLLKRRRRRKGKNGQWEDYWEDVEIKDIKKGDEILTLDETLGEFVPQKVKALMDMGSQEVFRLVTQFGKTIETTGNHPYLTIVKDILKDQRPQRLTTFEIDQSMRIEDKTADTILAIANKESSFLGKLDKKQKLALYLQYSKQNRPKIFGPEIFAKMIVATINKFDLKVTRLIIDREYSEGYDAVITTTIEAAYPDIIINFKSVGKHSPAHIAAFTAHINRNIKKNKKEEVVANSILKGFLASELLHQAFTRIRSPHYLLLKSNYITKWEKVNQLKQGDIIATVDGWEKISAKYSTGRKQTWDIEVEGTHNFVGNDIVAHNTYINSSTATGIALDIDANSLSSGSGLDISSTSTAAASNTQKGLNIALSGTNATSAQTTYGAYISNTHAGTTSTNVGLYATATGGTTANYAAIFESGNVGIGTTGPLAKLDISGLSSVTNLATSFGIKTGSIGTSATNYLYPFEIQTPSTSTSRLQLSPYRRIAGSDWQGVGYRMQIAVDNSFTDGSKAYVEVGADDPNSSGGGFISLGTAGSDRLSITNAGLVGIGTTAPGALLDLSKTFTSTTADSYYGQRNTIVNSGVVTTGTDNTYGFNIGLTRSGATPGNLSTINSYGGYITSTNTLDPSNTGASTNNYALYLSASKSGASQGTNNNYGLYLVTQNSAVSNGYGIYINNDTQVSNAATSSYGLFVNQNNNQTGVTSYGVYSKLASLQSGSTGYGLYVDAGSGAGTKYAASFLNGNVGIGTTSPTSTLHLVSTATTTNAASFTANSLTTGTLLQLTATAITSGSFFDINNGSSIFKISNTAVTTSLPFSDTASGDLSIAYDINMTNPTASFIKSAAPLYLVAGETFNSSNLTLQTYNQGSVVIDSAQTTGNAVDITNSTLTTGNILGITETSTAGGTSGSSYILNIAKSGANANATHTSYGIASSVTNSGTTSVNYGGLFTATGATTNYGLAVAAMTGATSTGLDIGALSGATANYGINIGNLTSAATANNFGLKIGTITSQASATSYGISTGAISGAGTATYGINLGANSSTATTNYGINIGAISGAGTTNYGLYVGAVSGATNNYAAIFAGGNVGIGTTGPGAKLDVAGNIQVSTNAGTNWVSGKSNLDLTGLFVWHDVATKNLTPVGVGVAINRAGTAAYFSNAGGYSAIFDAGNVGIGTTSPAGLLHVAGQCVTGDTLLKRKRKRSRKLVGMTGGNGPDPKDSGLGQNDEDEQQKTTLSDGSLTEQHFDDVMPSFSRTNITQDNDFVNPDSIGVKSVEVGGVEPPLPGLRNSAPHRSTPTPIKSITQMNDDWQGEGDYKDDDYYWEDVRIDQIEVGDEILTLDEKTGEFVPSRIKALQDMGYHETFEIITETGKSIRTTANHPYLVNTGKKDNDQDEYTNFFYHQTFESVLKTARTFYREVLEGEHIRVKALGNKKIYFSREGWDHIYTGHVSKLEIMSRFFALTKIIPILKLAKTTTAEKSRLDPTTTFWALQGIIEGVWVKVIIRETKDKPKHFYSVIWKGEDHSKEVKNAIKKGAVSRLYPRIQAWDKSLTFSTLLWNKYIKFIEESQEAVNKFNKLILPENRKNVNWIKVAELKAGQKIATVNGWERIISLKNIAREQVFDIEVENTHNFVGNNIVAHNTAIFGAGEGATPTVTTLRGAAAAGTNIAGANFTFDASNGTGTGGSGALIFRTAPTGTTGTTANTLAEIMRITPGGNVGIGTTAPTVQLDIRTLNTTTAGYVAVGNSDSTKYTAIYNGASLNDQPAFYWNTGSNMRFGVANTGGVAGAGFTEKMRIESGGNVGIGTTSPGSILVVNGSTAIKGTNVATGGNSYSPPLTLEGNGFTAVSTNTTGSFSLQTQPASATTAKLMLSVTGFVATANIYSFDQAGNVISKGTDTNSSTPDIAENIPVSDQTIEAGDVVTVDLNSAGDGSTYDNFKAMKSSMPYDQKILGVISTNPGLILHAPKDAVETGKRSDDSDRGLTLAGRTPVKVSTENGPIQKGDYLTSSSTPGVAMKATKAGPTIGKALENYNGLGVGKILVFVNVSYADPGAALTNLLLDNDGSLIVPKLKSNQLLISAGVNITPLQLNNNLVYQTTLTSTGDTAYNIDVAGSLSKISDKLNQLDLFKTKQATDSAQLAQEVASQSATIAQTKSTTLTLAQQLASAAAGLVQVKSDVDTLKLTPPDILYATGSATLANLTVSADATISGKLASYDLSVSNIFKSLGKAILGDTTVAGDITQDGTLSISSGNSINVIGTPTNGSNLTNLANGILFLQNSNLAQGLDILAGKFTFDTSGKLTVAGEVQAKQFSVSSSTTTDNSTGTGIIATGSTGATITNSLAKANSIILITPKIALNQTLAVTQKADGSFTVSLARPETTNIQFDYLIIGVK